MKSDARSFGLHSEEDAVRFLRRMGYKIVERNYRTRRGEIDLIAYDGDTLVFVEVKARRGSVFGGAAWSVDRRKQIRLEKAARHYLHYRQITDRDCRFDVVHIQLGDGKFTDFRLVKNAFEARRDYL